jgi:outer membrane immunogenic protein
MSGHLWTKNMNKTWFRIGVSALALATAQQAQAQGFYLGVGLERGNGDFNFNDWTSDSSTASLLAGYRYNVNDQFFVGGEIETSIASDFESADSSATLDRLSRLRLLAGYDFGQFAVFGAVGGAQIQGDLIFDGSGGNFSGTTLGLGTEVSVSDRVDLRLEAIQDNLSGDTDGASYDWDNTSIRAAATFKF